MAVLHGNVPVLQTPCNGVWFVFLLLEPVFRRRYFYHPVFLDLGITSALVVERSYKLLQFASGFKNRELLVPETGRKVVLYKFVDFPQPFRTDWIVCHVAAEIHIEGVVALEDVGILNPDWNLDSV